MSGIQTDYLNFKKVPKVLNVSGSSINSFSETSTPYSIRTAETSVTSTPLAGIPKEYRFNSRNSTPFAKARKAFNCLDSTNNNCSFCELPLQNVFEGEQIVDLKCGHILHLKCLMEVITSIKGVCYEIINENTPSKLICPKCNQETSCCDDSILINHNFTTQMNLPEFCNDVLDPNDHFSNIIASIDNFQIPNMTLKSNDTMLNSPLGSFDNDTEDPITPQNQIGMNFWDNEDDLIVSPVNYTKEANKSPMISSNNAIELSKTLFAPEFSSLNIKGKSSTDLSCVVNFTVTDFEPSLEFNKKEQIKTQIGKNKITDIIINNFKQNLANFSIDFSSVGDLILFDFIDITIKLNHFSSCQVYLFESIIVILNSEGNQLLLEQELNNQIFISSIFSNENKIIINLNSIKLPSIIFTSDNKILRHKWFVILNKMSKEIISSNSIPLIQISTNAWNLISSGSENDDDDNNNNNNNNNNEDDALPHDIKIFNKLTSRGLDLPSRFLKRQILRPDSIPLVLIIAIPLVNSEDYGLENNEYADVIKGLLKNILDSLHSDDKLGVVFLGNKNNTESALGNYYGCISKYWDGWKTMLELITESVIIEEGVYSTDSFWDDGIKYVELLSSMSFNNKIGKENVNYINEIIFVSSEIIGNKMIKAVSKDTSKIYNVSKPFLKTIEKTSSNSINQRISDLCFKFDASFNLILLADEFKYEVHQILKMNRFLKCHTNTEDKNTFEDYNNNIKLAIALDFESLNVKLETLINLFHNITVCKLETSISFPKFVQLKNFESNGGENEGLNEKQEYKISLRNLQSGYEKSLMFNIHIDFENENLFNNYKTTIATSKTKLFADKEITEFENDATIKFISGESNIERNITLNLNIENSETTIMEDPITTNSTVHSNNEDLNLSIVSRLSNVSDAYFIRRKIELLVAERLCEAVLEVQDFNTLKKEKAKTILKELTRTIWELSNSCNSSNTNNIKDNNIKIWSQQIIENLEDIIDGYSLRNYQLSNMKCISLFLEIE